LTATNARSPQEADVTHPEQGLGDRIASTARHVFETLERDVESLARPTPAEAIAETAAEADGATTAELEAQQPAALPVDLPIEHMTKADFDAGEAGA
jgi:hypothetical protein